MSDQIKSVCVYCASSMQADPSYREAAKRLGFVLGEAGIDVVYGGGRDGSMGAVADGALEAGGRVIGILPTFMHDVEPGHPGITELKLVGSMHVRKHAMIENVDAAIALPGGSGTFEELLEAITWKRLSLFLKPIVILNTHRYYDPLIKMLDVSIEQKFMDARHGSMWSVVEKPEDVIDAIKNAPKWDESSRSFASI